MHYDHPDDGLQDLHQRVKVASAAANNGDIPLVAVAYIILRILVHRLMNINDLESRGRVERLYVCMELYTRICSVWIKFAWPPTLFGLSITIIVAAFISIRYTQIPLYCYVFFPNTACAILFILFWVFYDLMIITRGSEEILGQLRSSEVPYLHGMPNAVRTKVMKRARAMRAVEVPVGEFADFSVTVPVTLWEEIVNQVVVLLAL